MQFPAPVPVVVAILTAMPDVIESVLTVSSKTPVVEAVMLTDMFPGAALILDVTVVAVDLVFAVALANPFFKVPVSLKTTCAIDSAIPVLELHPRGK